MPSPTLPPGKRTTDGKAGKENAMIGKTRHPWGVWGLSLITLGIYFLYWWYKANEEVNDFDPSIEVDPVLAMLALFVPICNIVTIVRTGQRIGQAQENTTGANDTNGWLGLLLAVIGGFDLVYYQSNLNKLWAAAPQVAGVAAPPPPPV
jgi:hypothetical protein